MDIRRLVKDLQEGVGLSSKQYLLLKDSIMLANNSNQLVEHLRKSTTPSRSPLLKTCLERASSYAHLDEATFSDAVSKFLAGAPAIVISHQPTLFSYSGVYVQFLLAEYLSNQLKNKFNIDVVIVYLCLDADDPWDRRIRTAHFPFPGVKEGAIPLSYKISPTLKRVPQFSVPYREDQFFVWRRSLSERFVTLYSMAPSIKNELKIAYENIDEYLGRLQDDSNRLKQASFADFSLNILMYFVRDLIEAPVLPLRYTDLYNTVRNLGNHVVERWGEIRKTGLKLSEAFQLKKSNMFDGGPGWVICKKCFYKNNSTHEELVDSLAGTVVAMMCAGCGKSMKRIDEDFIVMPKVILEDLLGRFMTGANLTLTYAGSAQHVVLSNLICEEVFALDSSIFTWHPKHLLGSPIEKAALHLANSPDKAAPAKKSLTLSSEGRDTLLFLAQFANKRDFSSEWYRHFAKMNLSQKMVLNEDYKFFYESERVLANSD